MNLFVVHANPLVAARMLCDKHVVKMPTETAQLLSTVARLHGVNIGYRLTHAKHPCTEWVGASRANFNWTLQHGLALCREFDIRYRHTHGALDVIADVKARVWRMKFRLQDRTPFAQVMPEIYQGDDAVEAYRKFYLGEKARFAAWKKGRKAPSWWPVEPAKQLNGDT